MRRSSARRLMRRTSELFVSDPELLEVAKASTDVLTVVSSHAGKPTPRSDEKSLCNVLFSDKQQKQMREAVDQLPMSQNSTVSSTTVSCEF